MSIVFSLRGNCRTNKESR